ncbi:MAG: M81 family metallopeptidase [Acetobacteraceae bacterium]
MRVAIGRLSQESNTFVPFKSTLATFEANGFYRGEAMLEAYGKARIAVPAFIDVLKGAGAEIVPLLATQAGASGPVERASFDLMVNEMALRLSRAGPVDAVLLALHGALVVEDEPDGDAEIIARVRSVLPQGTPIGVALDLHGHITPKMLQPDVFYIGYREYPHIDIYETGERVAQQMLGVLAGGVRPVMAMAKRPLLVSPVKARTTVAPLDRIVAEARRLEGDGGILHASLFPVQPWLDIPDLGFAVLVCADGDVAAAERTAEHLADLAWAARDEFEPDLVPLGEAIRIGLAGEGLTVVGDVGDAPSGGTMAEHTGVLCALLAAGAERAGRLTYLTLCDAEAAAQAAAAGPGHEVTLALGHKRAREGMPLTVSGTVKCITDGRFVMGDAGARGSEMALGLCAVLAIGDLRVAIRSVPANEWDTGTFTSVGLDLRRAALAFVKSPSHYRVSYAPLAARVLAADTPGATCGNMRKLRFTRVTRPLYPLDIVNADPEGRKAAREARA